MVRNFMRPAASLAAVGAALAGFAAWAPGGAQTVLGIDVLSSRPELVSGGDALVRIAGAAAAPQVTVGASDVSGAFRSDAKGGWVGLVAGLEDRRQ